ncbi:hypothetical protein [Kitasatospora sp. NPDC093679]|uniref:hypothetical protein n=1 Tax=Kitasatospora sp. NPDC093679 TaxID=3154983 RepID=UPI00343AC21A
MSTSSTQDVSRRAGDLSRTGRDFVVEDAGLRRLRHHLLRLTLAGLTHPEVDDRNGNRSSPKASAAPTSRTAAAAPAASTSRRPAPPGRPLRLRKCWVIDQLRGVIRWW